MVFEMFRCDVFKIFALASFFLLLNFVKLGILHSRVSWAVTQWLLCPIWRTRRRRGCELELNKFEVHRCDLFPHDNCLLKMKKKIVYWLLHKYVQYNILLRYYNDVAVEELDLFPLRIISRWICHCCTHPSQETYCNNNLLIWSCDVGCRSKPMRRCHSLQ